MNKQTAVHENIPQKITLENLVTNNIEEDTSKTELKKSEIYFTNFTTFANIFLNLLNKHAPQKKKIIRAKKVRNDKVAAKNKIS